MEQNRRLTAIILAAGYSSRMGELKPLLPLGNKTVIEKVVEAFQTAGIESVKIVVGYQASRIVSILEKLNVDILYNHEFDKGMFSSVQLGVKSLKYDDAKAFFITPADYALIKSETIKNLGEAYFNCKSNIIYPCYNGKRGHPPIISSELANEILRYDGQGGLRGLLIKQEKSAVNIEVDDEFVVRDMDTKEDYEKFIKIINKNL
ncbi:MAG: metal dependent phosphohydrolase [Clostridia bacterium]|nr:metal dependent phosphohydrolase [Clostridia bacterium]